MIEVSVRAYRNGFKAKYLSSTEVISEESTESEAKAVQKLGVKILGDVLFNYKEVESGIWQIQKVEPVASGVTGDVHVISGEKKRETNRLLKRRSRENKVQLQVDLSRDANAILESLAQEFGGKKAAIEALLKQHEQRPLAF